MGNARQQFVPQPENRSPRFGQSAYEASQNYATATNAGGLGPAADVAETLAAPLTSRTGGRFRIAGSISGTATAADQVTATIEADINGGGFLAIATQILQVSAAAGTRFSAGFDALTVAVPIGQTINVRVRAVDTTGNNITVAAGQATVNAQELPG